MTQYIDKDAVVAEINALLDDEFKCNSYDEATGFQNALTLVKKFIDTLEVKLEVEKEHVSDELEEASKEWLRPQLDKSYVNYGEVKMMELTHFDGYAMLDAIEFGAKWQEKQDQSTIELAEDHAMLAGMNKMEEQIMKNIWKSADDDDLPEYDREVIVLTQPYPLKDSEFAVHFAHRPDPKGWDGKSITTGEVEHYTPKTYDKGGWNIPDVKYWLNVKFPEEIEL